MLATVTATILPALILVHLLRFHHVGALPSDASHLNKARDTAPLLHEGPPLSASALRDRSKLKFEIIGIIFAYLIFIGGLLILLYTVGRRLRRNVQSSNRSLDMEMMKPAPEKAALGVGPSSVSPPKYWPSPAESEVKPWTSPTGNHYYQQSLTSLSTFDEKVVESDRLRNQKEMERLYAAVMAHDEQRVQAGETSPIKSSQRNPPELQHLRDTGSTSQPLNPKSTSPTQSKSPLISRASSILSKAASPLSILHSSHSRAASATSHKQRSSRISVRDLTISPPMGTPDLAQSVAYNDEQPFSPRTYNPGPPPLAPGQRLAVATGREEGTKVSFRAPAPSPLPLGTGTNSSNSLPFRQQYSGSLQSAPSTKTTFVERRESLLNPGPRTGAPVPYSPYMPFTPVTPITPGRLVTKEDRKKSKKHGGMKVLVEDDLVQGEKEMWGDSLKR